MKRSTLLTQLNPPHPSTPLIPLPLITLFAMFLLALPISFASLTITSEFTDYNKGDDIPLDITYFSEHKGDALVKVTLQCSSKNVLYYVSPLQLQKNKNIDVDLPNIKALAEGTCTILTEIVNIDNEVLESITSEEFTISKDLTLQVTASPDVASPGETIIVTINASKNEGKFENAFYTVEFQDKAETKKLKKESVTYKLYIPKDASSGLHGIDVTINDTDGNVADKNTVVTIRSIPKKVHIELVDNELAPEGVLRLTPVASDQGSDPIKTDINITITKKKLLFAGQILMSALVPANAPFVYKIPKDAAPGEYEVTATTDDLEDSSEFTIGEKSAISSTLSGNYITIKNEGNIPYNDQASIVLDQDGNTIVIEKKVKLEVGEQQTINLAEEVPAGNYEVKVIETQQSTETSETNNLITGNVVAPLAQGPISIEQDNRSGSKKMFAATGRAFAVAADAATNPFLAAVWLIILSAGVFFYFRRKGNGNNRTFYTDIPKERVQKEITKPRHGDLPQEQVQQTIEEENSQEAVTKIVDEEDD